MNLFNLIDLNKMGDFDEKWGQAYWGQDENGKNIKFNSMNQDIIAPCTILAEETAAKTSSKGTAYLQLKKVKVAESAQTEDAPKDIPKGATSTLGEAASTTAGNDAQLDRIEEQLQEINSKLDKLMGVDGSFIPDEDL